MGMFDHVTCELPMPDGREVVKDSFQTRSLYCVMVRFTITAQGRLIHNICRYEQDTEIASGVRIPQYRRVPVEDVDMDYHGDIEINGVTRDDGYFRYAVRFTHGTVEWIRPFDELPELHRTWLLERGW